MSIEAKVTQSNQKLEPNIFEEIPLEPRDTLYWAGEFVKSLDFVDPTKISTEDQEVSLEKTSDRCGVILHIERTFPHGKIIEDFITGTASSMGNLHPMIRYTSVLQIKNEGGFNISQTIADSKNSRSTVGYGKNLLQRLTPQPEDIRPQTK